MKTRFLKILMSLSVASLICSCSSPVPEKKLVLIDISGSNSSNINSTLNKVNEIYLSSGPKDTFDIYFFSSVKYLAYQGSKFNKDRDFLPFLKLGYEKTKEIKVKEGTSFDICKSILERTNDYSSAYILTDGYFEDSKITKIKTSPKTQINIVGLNIQNNEIVLNAFDNPKQVKIDFEGN
jgi:hypothetical protein